MKIGTLARLAGLTPPAIRYYESIGLIPSPPRTAKGYRDYPDGVLGRLRSVRRAQALGFTLEEIRRFFANDDNVGDRCGIRDLILAKVDRLDQQAQRLAATRTALLKLADACTTRHAADCCPILDSLEYDATPRVEIVRRHGDPHGEGLRSLVLDACAQSGFYPNCEVIEWVHGDADLPDGLAEHAPLTVLVNGVDIEADTAGAGEGAFCRLYHHGERLRPLPRMEALLAALAGACQ